tara:strand:+ start:1135 stop:1878 length:744 start_codon:yes stop_codon:yes gene_type:complete
MSNTINWGKIHGLSYSPETNLTGTAAAPSFTNTKSILLDGVDDYVDTPVINLGSTNTISFWVKSSSTNQGGLFGDNNASSLYALFWTPSTNNIFFRLGNGNSGYWGLQVASGLLSDGNWHHHCLTRNGTTLNYYIDAVLQTNVINNTLNASAGTVTTFQNFGARSDGTLPLTANLDEVAVFNSELSASDVTAIYNSGVPASLSSYSSLVSWWRCGDGDTSPTLTDNGTGGNNGTMTNFSTFSTDVPT